MVQYRLTNYDLEDLRKLLIYYKENDLDVNELNNVILLLSKKYSFDPYSYSINILTGIISERKKSDYLNGESKNNYKKHIDKAILKKDTNLDRIKTSVLGNLKIKHDENSKLINDLPLPIKEEEKYISKKISTIDNTSFDSYLLEFEGWIRTNDLTFLEVRKLISNLEYYRRMNEVKPNSVNDHTGYLYDFTRWVDSRGLTYLNLRKMLGILNQKRDMTIAL